MVVRDGCAVDQILPVGISGTKHAVSLALRTADVLDQIAELVAVHHVEGLLLLAEVGDDDLIRNFAESMIEDMSEDGIVIVYNKAFEASRNREIGEMYPDLKAEMERINGNIVDLMIPDRDRKSVV